MKKHLIIIFAIIFSCSLFAVDKEYIPESSVLVISSKIDNISQKAGVSTKELINDIIFNKLSTNFSEQRKDERVSYSFQNEIVNLLNFSKDSKAIMLDTLLDVAVITDTTDLEALDLLMIRIALEERIDILSGNGLNFRYLELDDNIAFAWNKEVFAVISASNPRYYNIPLSVEKEHLGLFETAKLIFSKKNYRKDKTLLEMYTKNNDVSIWLDSYYFCKLGMSTEALIYDVAGANEIIESWYKESSIVITADFSNAKINSVINSYYPKMPTDYAKLKKELDNVVLKYVNDNAMLGFISLAFNPIELGKLLDITMKQLDTSDMAKYVKNMLDGLGIKTYEELMILFGGDIFAYAFGDKDNEYAVNYLASVSIKNEAKVISLIETVLEQKSQEADGGYYISLGTDFNIYVKSGILYVGNNVAIENVLNNKISAATLSKYKTDIMKSKTIAVYIDLKTLLSTPYFKGAPVMMFEDMYLTAEYVSKSESKSIIEINFIDKSKNALEIIYNALK